MELIGYRAPWFSITRDSLWAYDILRELGFRYDSSLYDSPFVPRRIRPIPTRPFRVAGGPDGGLWEFPIAVARWGLTVLPLGGGAYWRALPEIALWRGLEKRRPPFDLPGRVLPHVRVGKRASARGPARGRESRGVGARNIQTPVQKRSARSDPRAGPRGRFAGSGSCPSATSSARTAMTPTRRYFEKHADAFDRVYARPHMYTWLLRPGPWRGRELAVSVVGQHSSPAVLDLGCGPGRVAEAVIDAGAAKYLGVDLAPKHARTRAGAPRRVGVGRASRRRLPRPRHPRGVRRRASAWSLRLSRGTGSRRGVDARPLLVDARCFVHST